MYGFQTDLADHSSTSVLGFNPFMPTGAFNICCPRDCVSRHNGGASGAPLGTPQSEGFKGGRTKLNFYSCGLKKKLCLTGIGLNFYSCEAYFFFYILISTWIKGLIGYRSLPMNVITSQGIRMCSGLYAGVPFGPFFKRNFQESSKKVIS